MELEEKEDTHAVFILLTADEEHTEMEVSDTMVTEVSMGELHDTEMVS
jgi:hypothetical protein